MCLEFVKRCRTRTRTHATLARCLRHLNEDLPGKVMPKMICNIGTGDVLWLVIYFRRQEVIAQHVPPEDDPVLMREMAALPSFTRYDFSSVNCEIILRIFPPVPPPKDMSASEEQEEESEDEEEEAGTAGATKANGSKDVKDTKKKEKKMFASLDEIMFQVLCVQPT